MITRCPDPGAVRAALDGERPDVEPHIHTCPTCRQRADVQQAAAAFADTTLAGESPSVDVDDALARFAAQKTATVVTLRTPPRRPWEGLSRAAAAVAVVAVLGGVLATPTGRAAAASLLERFRAEQVQVVPVNFTTVDPAALEALAGLTEVEGLDQLIEPQRVADLAAATTVAGFTPAPLDTDVLPPSSNGPVVVLAQAPQTVRVTFRDDAGLPAALRDAVLVLDVPGAVVQGIEGGEGPPAVVRGEAGSLEVTVEGGPTLAEVRDALLSLPGLPAETVAAVRAIEDWETTLPLPVPVEGIVWEDTTVNGRPAISFGDETGLASALLWRQDERFVGVGGRLPLSQIRGLAEAQ